MGVEVITPKENASTSETLRPYFLSPCEESVRLYQKLREFKEEYTPGVIIPLDRDPKSLRRIFGLNGGSSSDEPLAVYNITHPFQSGNKTVLAARLQPPGMNHDSRVVFFEQKGNEWTPLYTPTFDLEDPFVTVINNQLIFGGIYVGRIGYQTVFYRGRVIGDLEEFVRSPFMMKDIRLVQLADKSIGLFTRPQGEVGGLGQIGFTILQSLDELTPHAIVSAPLLAQRFPEGEWGGVNEAWSLADGRILALGHRSYLDRVGRHYYPWLFIHDPKTGISQDLGIIGASDDFPLTGSRAKGLNDVHFPGGIDWKERMLYGGLRDQYACRLQIPSLDEIIALRNLENMLTPDCPQLLFESQEAVSFVVE